MSRRTRHPVDIVLCAISGYALAAVPLAIVGWFESWIVLSAGTVASAAMAWLANRRVSPAVNGSSSDQHWLWVAAAVITGITMWHLVNAGDHVLNDRDPGVYVTTAAWLERHGDLTVEPTPGPFGAPGLSTRGAVESPILTGGGPGLHWEGGGRYHIQFQHLWPTVLAAGAWVLGDDGYSVVPAVVAGAALLAFYAVAARAVRPVLALVAVAAIGVSTPFAYIARDAFSEGLTMLFVCGALWMLVTGIDVRSARRVTLAGVLMGCAVMTRIDAPVYLVGVAVLLAVATIRRHDEPSEQWWQGRALPGFVAGAAGVSTVALADSLLRSRFYLVEHVGLVWRVVGVLAVVTMGSVLVVRHWTRNAGLRRWWMRWRKALSVAAGTAVALAAALAVARPALGADHVTDSARLRASVAVYQYRNGLPVDPTRTYAELTGHWLGWYFGWPLVALAAFGAVFAVWRIVRDEAPLSLEAAVLVGLPMLVLTMVEPSVTPDQPWAIRRFLPFSIPLVVLLAAVTINAVLDWARRVGSHRFRGVGAAGGVAAAALVVGGPAWATWPVRSFSPYRDEREAVLALCEGAGDDAAVIVIPGPQVGDDLAQPIRSLCGLPAVNTIGVITPGEVGRLQAAWAAQGRRLVVVAERETQLMLAGATPIARYDLSGHREIERTLDRRPSRLTADHHAVLLGLPD